MRIVIVQNHVFPIYEKVFCLFFGFFWKQRVSQANMLYSDFFLQPNKCQISLRIPHSSGYNKLLIV